MKPGQIVSVIGVDPGMTTGIGFVDYSDKKIVGHSGIQVDGDSACIVLEAMLSRYYADPNVVVRRYAGIEGFITGKGAGSKGNPADYTRRKVFEIAELLQLWGYKVEIRAAGAVKPKATDRLLTAAGLLGPPEMRHANDGKRHALFTSLNDAFMDNPLR